MNVFCLLLLFVGCVLITNGDAGDSEDLEERPFDLIKNLDPEFEDIPKPKPKPKPNFGKNVLDVCFIDNIQVIRLPKSVCQVVCNYITMYLHTPSNGFCSRQISTIGIQHRTKAVL